MRSAATSRDAKAMGTRDAGSAGERGTESVGKKERADTQLAKDSYTTDKQGVDIDGRAGDWQNYHYPRDNQIV